MGHLLENLTQLVEVPIEVLKMISYLVGVLFEDAVSNKHLEVLPHHHDDIIHGCLSKVYSKKDVNL